MLVETAEKFIAAQKNYTAMDLKMGEGMPRPLFATKSESPAVEHGGHIVLQAIEPPKCPIGLGHGPLREQPELENARPRPSNTPQSRALKV